MMNDITDKPSWDEKVFDRDIVAKWTDEAISKMGFTRDMVEWCIAELRDKALEFRRTGMVGVLDVGTEIVKSDTVVGAEIREELVRNCERLSAEVEVDWHPGSNGQVRNLVHPSLYSLVYGQSRIIDRGGDGDRSMTLENCLEFIRKGTVLGNPIDVKNGRDSDWKWSDKYQWLPCEVALKDDGTVKITSYINNLHPEHHRYMYKTVELLIECAIPLWNKCLATQTSCQPEKRIQCIKADYEGGEPNIYGMSKEDKLNIIKNWSEPEGPLFWLKTNDEMEDELQDVDNFDAWIDSDDYNIEAAIHGLWQVKRQLKIPDPGIYTSDFRKDLDPVNLVRHYKYKGLQVIVKIASIELTPENKKHAGGKWHLEGMANENIIATALYYYDCHNVTNSRLQFRHKAELDSSEMQYEQNDHSGLETIYGLPPGGLTDEPMTQELGSVSTIQGRMLAFRNHLQHRVDSFELIDATKPGWRRFVALWLVDPKSSVLSTRVIPPQRYDWWLEAVEQSTNMDERLPAQLTEMVRAEGRKMTMTMDEAKIHRLELMKERTAFAEHVDNRVAVDSYNFCEH